jgi:hypothetical protein
MGGVSLANVFSHEEHEGREESRFFASLRASWWMVSIATKKLKRHKPDVRDVEGQVGVYLLRLFAAVLKLSGLTR